MQTAPKRNRPFSLFQGGARREFTRFLLPPSCAKSPCRAGTGPFGIACRVFLSFPAFSSAQTYSPFGAPAPAPTPAEQNLGGGTYAAPVAEETAPPPQSEEPPPVIEQDLDTSNMVDYPIVRLRSLDKITARTQNFDARVGTTIKYGTLYIRIMACRKPPPIEEPEAAAFLQVWETDENNKPAWVFSGWMFESSPGLSAMDHPVYDVWVLDCLSNEEDDMRETENTPAEGDGKGRSDAKSAPPPSPEERAREKTDPVENQADTEAGASDPDHSAGGEILPQGTQESPAEAPGAGR